MALLIGSTAKEARRWAGTWTLASPQVSSCSSGFSAVGRARSTGRLMREASFPRSACRKGGPAVRQHADIILDETT